MKSIISFLSSALFDTGRYRVIDASQRNAILNELSFSATGCVDESCQLEIGKLLSAEMIVVGDIGFLGGRYILTAKLLETETSDTVKTAKGIYTDLGNLIDGMYQFANDLAGIEQTGDSPAVQEEEPPAEEVTPETIPENILETPKEKPFFSSLNSRKIAGLSLMAGGAAAAALGGFFITDFISYYNNEYTDALDAYDSGAESYPYGTTAWDALSLEERTVYFDTLADALTSAAEDKNKKLILSAAVTGGGILLLGTGLILFLLPEKPAAGNEAVSLLFEPGITQTSFGLSLSY